MTRALPPADPLRHDDTRPLAEEAEPRSTFLASLSQKLASVTDPDALVGIAMREVGQRLRVHRAFFCEVDDDREHARVLPDWHRHGRAVAGSYPFAAFGTRDCWRAAASGVVAIEDIWLHPWTAAYARSYGALDIGAWLLAPCVRDGRWVASLVVADQAARVWTRDEALLVEHVAARVWPLVERARTARDLAATRQIAEQQARLFQTTLAAVSDYVFTFEPDGRVAFANASLLELWGVTSDQAVGRTMAELGYASEVEQRLLADLRAVVASGHRVTGETGYTSSTGDHRHYEYVLSPVVDATGRVVQVAGVSRDVTARRAADAEIAAALDRERAARAEAERSSRIKDDFLATLSHELRTPLNAILGWAQMIRRPDAEPEDVRRGLTVIERNARAQAQLIDDLLDMSRVTSGTLRLDVQPVLVREVLEAAAAAARPAADARHLQLHIDCDPPALLGLADPHRLQQVVWNLVSNAVKFTPPGGRVELRARREEGRGLEIAVSDTGAGIDPAFLPHVFDAFRQADGSSTRRHGGLGLGLTIVKHLVELHGGDVRVHSDGVGRGARFVVTLPIAAATDRRAQVAPHHAEAALPPPACTTLEGLTVLIVARDPDVQDLLCHVVERCGARAHVAGTAEDAVRRIDADPPDVIVSDTDDADGAAALAPLGGASRAHAHAIPVVALVPAGETRPRGEASSVRCLVKPLVPDALVQALWAATRTSLQGVATPATAPSVKGPIAMSHDTQDPLHDHPDEQARRERPAEEAVKESEAVVENESHQGKQMPPLREAYGGEPDERHEQSR